MAEPFGSAPGIIVGVGVGAAAGAALEAAVELPRQKVWADNPNKLLDPAVVARLVAQGAVALGDGRAGALPSLGALRFSISGGDFQRGASLQTFGPVRFTVGVAAGRHHAGGTLRSRSWVLFSFIPRNSRKRTLPSRR